MIDVKTVRQSVPANIRNYVTPSLVDTLNNLSHDPDEAEMLKENALTYMHILATGKFKMGDYLNAVKYVTHLNLGSKTLEAWTKVFPDRYARLVAKNTPEKIIYTHASAYKKTQMVVALMEQMLIPVHILNAPFVQEAINKQVDLMRNARSERIQLEAANNLMTQLRPPETTKIEIDMGVKESSAMQELKDVTAQLAAQQKALIESGVTTAKDVAHQGLLIEGKTDE